MSRIRHYEVGDAFMRGLGTAELALRAIGKARRTLSRDGRMIVVSSMPKSGSTFLTRSIAAVTGYEHSYLACSYGNVDQEIYLPKVIDAYGRGTVTQQHFKANDHNLELLKFYGIRPVVLVRNLFDVLVSVRDHLVNENLHNLPGAHVPDRLLDLSVERQIDFIVDLIAPWYIGYIASWARAEANGFPFLWMSYEDAVADWPGAVSQVLSFYGITRPRDAVVSAVESVRQGPQKKNRFNRGIVGRGSTILSSRQRERVIRLTEYYCCDFSRIGIERPAALPA